MKTTKKFNQLQSMSDDDLLKYHKPIKSLWDKWPEYTNQIIDYSTNQVAVTNRLLRPYITSELHGENVWDGLVELVKDLKVQSIVDLGCGAGEFFTKLSPNLELYGLTIDVSEVYYARNTYHLPNIIPADMRDVNKYFKPDSIDMVVAHRSFDFIDPKDRIDTMIDVYGVLKPHGFFVYIDDERFEQSKMPQWDFSQYYKLYQPNKTYYAKGKITILEKVCVPKTAL